ncbi:UDP-N-acetylglucosamine 2-epimerase (non-hydrolyzing) [Solirubrobacter phytolaccae]|uniref:UDP-N-acetylglucosamine 2-epimerase (Non-hydrolyzing) n=1 Tax=Solirubrobacter phytolaccae TaxID=1404360 RepID=A0A9X3SEC6_9ACTN|nr:UDP-N-acetylglucosamine 2-epimerase (non-hydrolyzing) [Solirubrobacter phytolaccae]MDA0180302.1 UDP-N-acetylglucosamine 2-epimerase (non-hydrolyzing) [Solirubrobacter phytolaccae]
MNDDTNTNLTVLAGGRLGGTSSSFVRHRPPTAPYDTIVHVVGARPNFVKMAPVISALERRGAFRQVIVHTGQHYDARMSDEILADLEFPVPDRFLKIGSGAHGEQTAKVLVAFEEVLRDEQPVAVVVAGDVNSTLGCALAAAKHGIPVAHVEAGLRSFDWGMPEEVNRVLTDRLSDLLFTHSPEAVDNLRAEGVVDGRIHHVGNTMIDSLRRSERTARDRRAWAQVGVERGEYALVTLHRPSNVDDPQQLMRIVEALDGLAHRFPVVFPIHPRTRARLGEAGVNRLENAGVRCIDPLGYLDFLSLQSGAGAVVTDSGGVQEETSALGVRCYTFRPSTERPITLSHGTNILLGDDPASLAEVQLVDWEATPSAIPLWDGHAGERVAEVLINNYALTQAFAAHG